MNGLQSKLKFRKVFTNIFFSFCHKGVCSVYSIQMVFAFLHIEDTCSSNSSQLLYFAFLTRFISPLSAFVLQIVLSSSSKFISFASFLKNISSKSLINMFNHIVDIMNPCGTLKEIIQNRHSVSFIFTVPFFVFKCN